MGGTINLTGVPDFDQLEIVKEGKVAVTLTNSVIASTNVAHNLGFVPLVIAAFDDVGVGSLFTDGDLMLPTPTSWSLDNVNHVIKFVAYISAGSDINNLYLITSNSSASDQGPFPVKFYLIRKRSR